MKRLTKAMLAHAADEAKADAEIMAQQVVDLERDLRYTRGEITRLRESLETANKAIADLILSKQQARDHNSVLRKRLADENKRCIELLEEIIQSYRQREADKEEESSK